VQRFQSCKSRLSQACEPTVAATTINKLTREDLLQTADAIASDVVDFIIQDPGQTKLKLLALTSSELPGRRLTNLAVWRCCRVYAGCNLDRFKFLDLGGLLADALVSKLNSAGSRFQNSPQTIRATVTGAGMYSMQVSGATIDFDIDHLPLRNVPLGAPFRAFQSDAEH